MPGSDAGAHHGDIQMKSVTRSLCIAGALAGAFAFAAPNQALAQGKGKPAKAEHKVEHKAEHKATEAEHKMEHKADKAVHKTRVVTPVRHRTTTYRSRVLCEDGAVVTRTTNACANHGGVASRQGSYDRYPPASARARARASSNSAVVRGIGANNTRSGAIARCSDGTYWHSNTRTGACYRHGGVAAWY